MEGDREPRGMIAGGVRETGEERGGSGSSKRAGGEREMQNTKCTFLIYEYVRILSKTYTQQCYLT